MLVKNQSRSHRWVSGECFIAGDGIVNWDFPTVLTCPVFLPPSNQMFQWKIYSFSLWWLFYQSISCQRPRATKPCPPLFYTSFHDMWLFTFRSVDQCLIPFARNSSSSQWLFSFLFSVQNQNNPKKFVQSKKRICVNNVSVIFNGSPFFSLSRFSKTKRKRSFREIQMANR